MLIDCHTHAFADKIADKAVDHLIHYYQISTPHAGNLRALMTQANLAGLDAIFMLVAATKYEQVKPAHDWMLSIAEMSHEELATHCVMSSVPTIVPFGTFHPDDPHWLEEIDRLRAHGIRGIKLHPEFQGIDLGDPRLHEFFEEVAGEFVLMIHVGDPQVTPNNCSTPAKIAAILRMFPQLTMIAAHMGGYCFWDDVERDLAGLPVYLDTSSTLPYIDSGLLRRLINRHGVEHILMGSDYPLRSPVDELADITRITWLSDADKAAICGGNAARLIKL